MFVGDGVAPKHSQDSKQEMKLLTLLVAASVALVVAVVAVSLATASASAAALGANNNAAAAETTATEGVRGRNLKTKGKGARGWRRPNEFRSSKKVAPSATQTTSAPALSVSDSADSASDSTSTAEADVEPEEREYEYESNKKAMLGEDCLTTKVLRKCRRGLSCSTKSGKCTNPFTCEAVCGVRPLAQCYDPIPDSAPGCACLRFNGRCVYAH